MPRNPKTETDRATIAKLRIKIAQLEARLSDIQLNPPEPDKTGVTLDGFLKSYAPSLEEEKELQAEFLSYIIQFGWNRHILNREGLTAYLSESDNDGVAELLHIDRQLACDLANDIFNLKQADPRDYTAPPDAELSAD